MAKRLIPFRLLPGSWGLAGKVYDQAEAAYNLEGEALDRRLAEIEHRQDPKLLAETLLAIDVRYGHRDAYDAERALLALHGKGDDPRALAALDLKHGRIGPVEHDTRLIDLDTEDAAKRGLLRLDVRLKHNEITKLDYDKQRATLLENPWIGIVDQGFDMEQGVSGVYFEFDWNTFWIDYLRLNGYVGHSDEEIVEEWFQNVCRATAAAPLAGDFDAPPPGMPPRKANSVRRNDGTFYS